MQRLLDRNTSLDDIFKVICIPVLLTYNSAVVKNAQTVSKQFFDELCVEFDKVDKSFREKLASREIKVHLILLPLKNKSDLVKTLDGRLKALQS